MGYSIKGGKKTRRRSTNKITKGGRKSVKRGGRVTFPLKYFKETASNLSNLLHSPENATKIVVIKGGRKRSKRSKRSKRK